MIRIYHGPEAVLAEREGDYRQIEGDWASLTTDEALPERIVALYQQGRPCAVPSVLRAPIAAQEVWAAGVTYQRSCHARMAESAPVGGGNFYDRIYHAERPELFFKGSAHRTVEPGGAMPLRKDATWNVPEPELALLLSPKGRVLGFTAGNDLSSRDIEGENPLYLPQAKVWRGSCALGPGIAIGEVPAAVAIGLRIERGGAVAFAGETSTAQMKQTLPNLVEHLLRADDFPHGAFLLTGTGIVPDDGFSLCSGDRIQITVEHVGTLSNSIQ